MKHPSPRRRWASGNAPEPTSAEPSTHGGLDDHITNVAVDAGSVEPTNSAEPGDGVDGYATGPALEEGTDVVPLPAEWGDATLITESGLAKLFRRHPSSVKRAIERRELPESVRILGRPFFSIGSIRRHIEKRLEEKVSEQERVDEAMEKHRP